MALLTDPEFWARGFGIIVINLLLSGDNALVIALAVRRLPRREQLLGRVWGTAGAVGLRIAFIGIVSLLLRIPLLQLAGGLLLVWIAVKLVQQETGVEAEVRHGTTFWEAIWIIIVADMAMSLDNVLAVAAAAQGDMVLIVFGIGLSVPFVVWGAGILARLMNRFVWIVWIGGGVLGYVAGEMILKDSLVHGWLGGGVAEFLHHPLPVGLGIIVGALGWWFAQGHRHRKRIPEKL